MFGCSVIVHNRSGHEGSDLAQMFNQNLKRIDNYPIGMN